MGDYYNIQDDWKEFKSEIIELENYFESIFVKKPTSRKYSILIRKKSKSTELFGEKIRKNVLKKCQDLMSDYS
jgi:hypothetical protein